MDLIEWQSERKSSSSTASFSRWLPQPGLDQAKAGAKNCVLVFMVAVIHLPGLSAAALQGLLTRCWVESGAGRS